MNMTREQIIKHWDVIEDYKNGAEIQYFSESSNKWLDTGVPLFLMSRRYRVKSRPKYVPYDTKQECLEQIGKTAVNKHGCGFLILAYHRDRIIMTQHNDFSPEFLFENFTKLDGSPFGKLKE